ncbi:MAG: hypothetical protein P8N56_05850, partial [Schleiferiaceae bacterium]|nr:hypothetical protein [Schleiferiaceae bacterium]
MRTIPSFTVLIVIFGLFFSSCTHDPLPRDPNPIDTTAVGSLICDPDTVYFQQDVLPLIVSSCAMSGCHDAASAQDGVVLTSYAKIMQTGDIKVGEPNNSDLYKALVETNPNKIMPPPPASLTAAQIQLIKTWIQQGAQNNSCESGCDTTAYTFSGTIQPMMQTFCVGCHNASSAPAYVVLDQYAGVVAATTNNRLMGAVKHQSGYVAMPPSGNGLTDCQIQQLEKWIAAGAPN